jgi:hypothetical protein
MSFVTVIAVYPKKAMTVQGLSQRQVNRKDLLG